MDEIFPRESAERPQPFTGERLTSALSGQTQIEHYHRYLFARALCADLDVLDVAGGEGYGSAQLAQVARSVVGVEYDHETVQSAQSNFPRPNLTFMQGDARDLPLADASVDAVVSFETIEHFDRQEDFVSEVFRVLRPDGRFIVSTPDREVYSPPGSTPNPFHVRELTRAEFIALLHRHFANVAILTQRPMLGSVLLADTPTAAAPLVFERLGRTRFTRGTVLPNAPYLVAVASNAPLPTLPDSLFIDRSDLDTDSLAADTLRAQRDEANHRAAAAEAEKNAANERAAAAEAERNVLAGSLRQFLRAYWPRLKRHLFG